MTDGRFALVTGGAQGIGFATAKRFLEIGFGGVLLVDRNGGRLEENAAILSELGRVETLEGDLMDLALPARAVGTALDAFGRLDVLVNAAGNTERCGITDTSHESYERLFGVNVRAPLFLMQEALISMVQQKSKKAPSSTSRACWPMVVPPISRPIRPPRQHSAHLPSRPPIQ
ncbi:MAG: SDR family NAD(P)-dependent oxidoreductase [Alphaproteobacteria bacterium]|nr:SDR family NAD(P)-dependent oxidoreductase [Alphaproteobacteria bacterium]